MELSDLILYDKRTFCEFYYDFLKSDHIFLKAFVLKTLIVPQYIRIHSFFFFIFCAMMINAFLYNLDDNTDNIPFFSKLISELPLSIWSAIISISITFMSRLILYIPRDYAKNFNESLKTKDKIKIKDGYELYKNRMRCRYVIFITMTVLIEGFCIYYLVIFCNIYYLSSMNWFKNSLISIAFALLCLEPIIPLIMSLLRTIAFNFKSFRFLFYIQSMVRILKVFG